MLPIVKKIKRELWTNYRDHQFLKPDLRIIQWEATIACNLKCQHCGSNAVQAVPNDQLSTKEIKDCFKEIAREVDTENVWIGVTGGEPLMRKDLFEVMRYANDLGFDWTLMTNGVLINSENLEKMEESGLRTLSVSIDGFEDSHDEFRGVKGSWEKAIRGIRAAVENKAIKKVDVMTCINSYNIEELDQLYSFLSDLGIDSWRLMTTDLIGRAKDNLALQISNDQLIRVLNLVKNKRKDTESKLNVSWGCSGYYGPEYEKEIRDHFFFCNTGINIASILFNGDIFVCTDVPRRKEFIQGNIREDSFMEVWRNKFQNFREKTRTLGAKCNGCSQKEFCLGGGFHCFDFDKRQPDRCWRDFQR